MWMIENSPGKFSCFRIVMRVARTRLKANPEMPPLVRYLGIKPPWPNRDGQRTDFYLLPPHPGTPQYNIDPTYYGNPNPNP